MTHSFGLTRRAAVAGLALAPGLAFAQRPASASDPLTGPGYRVVERPERDRLGEGVIWSKKRNSLLWVDILNPMVHALNLATGAISSWPVPELICWIIERALRDDFIVGTKSSFAILSLDPVRITPIGRPEPDRPRNRLNDAKVDREGRVWACTMTEGGGAEGALYRMDRDRSWKRMDDGYQVGNGPAFSPDGRTLYQSDTPRKTVFAFDLARDGTLSNKRVFLRFEDPTWGVPDGMTTDSQGFIWICCWDGHRVQRFAPDGRLDRTLMLPAQRVTDIVFAGPKLNRLFVSSAMVGLKPGSSFDGVLFEVDASGAHGWPAVPFAG